MHGPLNVKKVLCPILLSSFKHIYGSLERFSHKYPIQNFTETRPVGAEKMRTDGRMWSFGNFRDYANAPQTTH